MLIFKNKTQPGIFKKYQNKNRDFSFENIFTGETIGPGGKSRGFDHNLSASGKWKVGDFYVVSEK